MSRLRQFVSRVRGMFAKNRFEQELDEELRVHLEMLVEDNVRRGMTQQEARLAARRSFGGIEQMKEAYRDQRGLPIMETFLQDIRYGYRMLGKNPGFTIVAVLTLALGIGANTAIFSVLDAVMLKTLPVSNPQQLVLVNWTAKDWPALVEDLEGSNRKDPASGTWLSESVPYPIFEALRTQTTTLSEVFAFSANVNDFNVQFGGKPYSAASEPVSGNYFNGLGVQTVLGRPILPSDDVATAPPVAVLSYGFWKGKLGGDESVVGKPIVINSLPLTVVGVAPPEFVGTQPGEDNDIWITLHMYPPLVQALNFAGPVQLRRRRGSRSCSLLGKGEHLVGDGESSSSIKIPGLTSGKELFDLHRHLIGPGYFAALGIPKLMGRVLDERDNASAPKVAVVNQSLARNAFGEDDPLGRILRFGTDEEPRDFEIVGVVGDAKYNDLRNAAPPTAYFSYLQAINAASFMTFQVRTSTDPDALVAALRSEVAEVDTNIPINRVDTLVQRIDKALLFERLFSRLTGSFGLVALVLVCVGLYGTMSYFVARQTNEIGIRMALGAQPVRVFRMVLVEGLKLTGAGVAIGLLGAAAGTRLISSALYDVPAIDPPTFISVALMLVAVGLLACYIPARRAMRVDPMVALRYE